MEDKEETQAYTRVVDEKEQVTPRYQRLRQRLMPDDYRPLEAKLDPVYPHWNITVEHEAIPVLEGNKLADLSLILRQEYDDASNTKSVWLEQIIASTGVIWQRNKQ